MCVLIWKRPQNVALTMKGSFKFMPEGGGIQYSLVIQDILWNYKYFMIIMEEVYLDWDPDMVSVNILLNSSPFTTVMSLLILVQILTLLRFTHHKLTTSRTFVFSWSVLTTFSHHRDFMGLKLFFHLLFLAPPEA